MLAFTLGHNTDAKSRHHRARKKWLEGQSRILELPEDKPTTVGGYLEWLYSRSIQVENPKKRGVHEYRHLTGLYVFGEKIQDDDFCDAVMQAMAKECDRHDEDGDCTGWVPSNREIRTLYDGTLAGSPARRFVVDVHVACGDVDWLKEDEFEVLPREFLLELARALLGRRDPCAGWAAVGHVHRWLKKVHR